mgnify:FL=1
MKPLSSMRRRRYEGDGLCIYCRTPHPKEQLTDEHIIPLALNGDEIIRFAACEPCRKISNESYENQALQADLLLPRLLLKLKRRHLNKKKELPRVAEGNIVNQVGGNFDIPIAENQYPKGFSLVRLPPPGFLSGQDQSTGIPSFRLQFVTLQMPQPAFIPDVTFRTKVDLGSFCMTLAKIGYCFAFAQYGIDRFESTKIRCLLLNERQDVFNFVGSAPDEDVGASHYLHWLSYLVVAGVLVVRVHLFGSFGMHPYYVVVGKIHEPSNSGASEA